MSKEDNNTESEVDPSLVFPKCGVLLSFLVDEFIEECGGREALEGLSSEQVCEQFIKPATIADTEPCSYCELLQRKNHNAYRKTAQVFISHAHQKEFLNVINALQ